MMKKYLAPSATIIVFEETDVITASGGEEQYDNNKDDIFSKTFGSLFD